MNSTAPATRPSKAAGPSHPAGRIWTVGTLTYTTPSLLVLFGWLLWGDFAWQMRDRAVPQVIQLLFKKYGASDTLVATLFSSLPLTIALVTGPFISYLSDRHRGRWGRRIPFIFATTPFIVVSIAALAFSPIMGGYFSRFLGSMGPDVTILIFLATFWMIFEFACGVASMLFGGLANDVVPQEVLGRFFALFRVVSLVAGIIFSHWILGKAETHYVGIFLGVGLLYAAGFTALCLKVREGEYPPPPPVAVRTETWLKRLGAATMEYIKNGYSHPYYLWLFAATILSGLAMVPSNLYNIFYAKSLGMTMATYGDYLTVSFVVSLCLSYPLGILTDRFHPLRMVILTLGLYMLVMFWSASYARDLPTFGLSLVIQSVLAGSFYTVSLPLNQRLLPRNKFAQIGSAGGTINCIIGILFAPAVGVVLDRSHHNYVTIYDIAYVIAAAGFVSLLVLHSKFMALGGPKNYVAPYDDSGS